MLRAPRWIVLVAALATACAPARREALVPLPDNPAPAYPAALRDAGLTGSVVIKMRVDRTGAVIPSSVTVISETDSAFTAEVRRVIPAWRFQRRPGDTTEHVVEQRFAFKMRPPTAAECRALVARENAATPQDLRVLASRLPARSGAREPAKTVAEFVVDTTGRADVATLRIVQSSLADRDARTALERVLSDWRFEPASTGGCAYAATTRHEFVY